MKNKMLVVDDEPLILEMLKATFERYGFDVWTASTVAEALKYFEKIMFNVVISDWEIEPGINGAPVIAAAKRCQLTKTIVCSGAYYSKFEEIEASRADAIIAKPYAMEDLFSEVNTLTTQDRHVAA